MRVGIHASRTVKTDLPRETYLSIPIPVETCRNTLVRYLLPVVTHLTTAPLALHYPAAHVAQCLGWPVCAAVHMRHGIGTTSVNSSLCHPHAGRPCAWAGQLLVFLESWVASLVAPYRRSSQSHVLCIHDITKVGPSRDAIHVP